MAVPDLRKHLIVALDVATATQAQHLVSQLGDTAVWYKVGLQLFTAEGPGIVRDLVSSGRKVFLDLKFNDIPNTMAAAAASAAALNVGMFTVHASAGFAGLKAAADAAKASPANPIVLAVTVLTSMDSGDLAEIGVSEPLSQQVMRMADLAHRAGCKGLVASSHELRVLRQKYPGMSGSEAVTIVVPGIRPAGSDRGDQSRTGTPAETIAAGASCIVVGRPITQAANPAQAVHDILREIESGVGVNRAG